MRPGGKLAARALTHLVLHSDRDGLSGGLLVGALVGHRLTDVLQMLESVASSLSHELSEKQMLDAVVLG